MIGKIVKELIPTENNRRNSEGSFARLSDGSIAFAYTRYRRGMEDGDCADLAVIFSYDGGESFGEPRIILTPEACGAVNLMSVSLVELVGGEIAIFYIKKMPGLEANTFMRKTRDFISFTEEVRCVSDGGYRGVVNDRVRRLSDGRLIFAEFYIPITKLIDNVDHGNLKNENGSFNVIFHPSVAIFSESRDNGDSWKIIGECKMPYEIFDTGLQEPGVEELSDGRLYSVFRNNSGRQFEAYSTDGGHTWSTPAPSRFTSPPSPMCTRRLSDGRMIFVYNPAPLYYGRGEIRSGIWTGGRNPLVMQLADGELKSFGRVIEIENDESCGFGYCAAYELDGELLLGYCAGGAEDGMMLNRTRIRKIKLSELE